MSVDQEACGRAGPGVDSGTSELDRWVGVRPTRYALWRNTGSWCLGVLCLLTIIASAAPSGADPPHGLQPHNIELGSPSPHWVLYGMFESQAETSKYVLLDADTAKYKAWLSTGFLPSLQQSPDGREIYVADTYLDGPERLRRDVLSIYDASDYSFSSKLEMPENSRAMMGPRATTALIDDGRFLVLFTFTPATGIRVMDTSARRFVAEVATPGCSLVYPTGKRGVSMLCGDGRMPTLHFDSSGQLTKRVTGEPFFDPDVDPVQENAGVIEGTWYFPSYSGKIYPVDLSRDEPVFHEPWALVDHDSEPKEERAGFMSKLLPFLGQGKEEGSWHPGGVQLISTHAERGELFVLMHPRALSGDANDHAFPGKEVWVYDISTKARTRRIKLNSLTNAIHVTADDQPLLVTAGVSVLHGEGKESHAPVAEEVVPVFSIVEVYDAVAGDYLRETKDTGIVWSIEAVSGSGGVR